MIKRFLFLFSSLFLILFSTYYFRYFLISDTKHINEKQLHTWGYNLVFDKDNSNTKGPLKVAILDSGINKEHEDLENLKFYEYNVIKKGEKIEDKLGHGTAIAGIIAAEDNEVGVVGLLKNVEMYDVKLLDDKGNGDIHDLIEAIEWCIENEVDIINLSFGFHTENESLKEVIDRALLEGIIIIAAIGNTYGMRGDYPALYEGVYSITSVNENLKRSSFAAKKNIDFAMPGENIYTTDRDGGYSSFSGTSFATAYATGIISNLLLEYRGKPNYFKQSTSFDEYLKKHTFFSEEWTFNDYGFGILNLRGEELK